MGFGAFGFGRRPVRVTGVGDGLRASALATVLAASCLASGCAAEDTGESVKLNPQPEIPSGFLAPQSEVASDLAERGGSSDAKSGLRGASQRASSQTIRRPLRAPDALAEGGADAGAEDGVEPAP